MLTNDIKSGARIKLRNGWFATMRDNKKGNSRMAEVEGFYTETGSVYGHDIVAVLVNGQWMTVEHTDKQKQVRAMNRAFFGG